MRKILTSIAIIISLQSFGQSSQKENRIDSVALWNNHLDSVISKTSIKDFQSWLYENATIKQYNESKFVDLYNYFVQYQLQRWLQTKSEPKK